MDKVHRVLRDLGRVGLTALAYALAGWLALCLAAPPAYAAPFYPAAGVALAATLTFGRPAIVGTWLGAFVVNALLGDSRGLADWQAVATGGLIAAGAAAQALLGATLVGRRLPPPRELSEPRDALLLFGLGGALACLVSASVAVITLVQLQALPAAAAYATFVSWWSGDALGVLLGTPVVLTLIGQPRHVWAPRRLTVALPLVLLSAGVAVATLMLARNDVERSRGVFERDASRAADVLVWGCAHRCMRSKRCTGSTWARPRSARRSSGTPPRPGWRKRPRSPRSASTSACPGRRSTTRPAASRPRTAGRGGPSTAPTPPPV